MAALIAILILLAAATPVAAQHPSIKAGDWLRVDFRARFQGDIRRSEAPIDGQDDNLLEISDRRVGVEGQVGRVLEYEVEYETSRRQWRDAYLNYRYSKALQVQAGSFKVPFGLEANTRATDLDFIYRSRISSRLAPGRDQGFAVHGRGLKGFLAYEGGVFRHDGDNARPSHGVRVYGEQMTAGRVAVYPFQKRARLGELRVGGALSSTNLPLGFPAVRAKTVFGASFFDSDMWVKGRRQRSALEVRWRGYRTTVQSEYIRLTDERRGQGMEDNDLSSLLAHGWYLSGMYALTGKHSKVGRVELAARLETFKFGTKTPGLEWSSSARPETQLGNADQIATFGTNWHINRWMKIQVNLIREAIQRPAMGPLPDRSAFWSRAFRLQFTI
jgi:phosphate-selective porin